MDNARQVVRWSIPGFVLALELAVFAATLRLAEGRDPLKVIEAGGTTAAIVSVLAGVPVGFLIYQLYFRNYRPFGYSLLLTIRQLSLLPRDVVRHVRGELSWRDIRENCAFVRVDRGAAILQEYLARGGREDLVTHVWPRLDLPEHDLGKSIEEVAEYTPVLGRIRMLRLLPGEHNGCEAMLCFVCRTRYERRFRRNWAIVMAMLDFTSGFQHAGVIKSEYTSGSDIYHALGATRTAIVGAWYLSLGYLFLVARPAAPQLVLGALAMSVLAFTQYKVLSSARRQAFLNLVARVATGLAWFSRTDWRTVTAASTGVTAPRRR